MGFFDALRQAKHGRQGAYRESLGIQRSSDSDVRCVECRYVSAYSGSSTRQCRLHNVAVDANEVCVRFTKS